MGSSFENKILTMKESLRWGVPGMGEVYFCFYVRKGRVKFQTDESRGSVCNRSHKHCY
jgi:hypothetical protein